MVRIARNTGVAVTRACSRKSAAENPMFHVEWFLNKQKGYDQFMHISNNNTEYSRYEKFDLTRMFNKQCFVIQIYQTAKVDYIWIIFLVPLFLIEYKS